MPDKHEVGGSSPLGPTTYFLREESKAKKLPKREREIITTTLWGCSSAGRAPALQAGGHGFESHHLHHSYLQCKKRNQKTSMKFLWLPFFTKKVTQMFIENRINKRNETDSCILRKTCYWDIFSKRFFRTKEVGKNNFVNSDSKMSGRTNQWIIKPKGLLIYNPKNNYLRSSSKKSWKFPKELILIGEQKAVQAKKSVRWMPWHWEPKKDAITCDKLR